MNAKKDPSIECYSWKRLRVNEGIEREEWECEMKEWMKFWTFDFVINQNEIVFNVKLECANAELATYFI